MRWSESDYDLQLDRQSRDYPWRLISVVASLILVTLAWRALSQSAFYWLAMFVIGVLTWIASYGWRDALASLISLLQRLEQV